ncbi:MAG: hypothetical protein Q7S54_01180 [bacterium]|nr:hypothetical protein [bacterium]
MGNLEKRNKKLIRRTKVQEAILLTIASGGRLGANLVIGQVVAALTGSDYVITARKIDIVRSAASRLRKNGLVTFKDGYYSLTESGERILKNWERSNYQIKLPKKWDGKWRMIIFDIPEKKRVIRRQISVIFKEAGFRRLQDSVWVYPYDCEDVIGLLKTDYGIGRDLLYVIADQIENDKYLRMEFDLL